MDSSQTGCAFRGQHRSQDGPSAGPGGLTPPAPHPPTHHPPTHSTGYLCYLPVIWEESIWPQATPGGQEGQVGETEAGGT